MPPPIKIVSTLGLTDDDIDVVQQYAIWYFTNRDSDEFNVTTYPAVNLTRYDMIRTEEEMEIKEVTGSYADFTPATFPEELSYSLRQDFANMLYQYLINSATLAEEPATVIYPSIDYDFINQNANTEIKDGYGVTGPFKIKSGTAASTE